MPRALKRSEMDRDQWKGYVALWGPEEDPYEELDWEALELQEKGRQALRETHNEEES